MGLLNIQTALALGVAEVVAVEPNETRRSAAIEFGAASAFTPEQATGLDRSADLVMIGPGHPEVIRQSLNYARDASTACLFAPTATGVLTELDLGDLYFREVNLVPSYSCGPEDTRAASRLIAEKKVDPSRMITHRFPLDRAQEALDTARGGGAAIKVIVTFPEAK